MPNNILITPSSASIQFSGSAANTIRLQVESSGSVAFYGNSGSLYNISDSLSGSLMSVNDISGLPILEIFSDDRVVMGSLNRNTLIVTGSRVGIRKAAPTAELDISGSVLLSGSFVINPTAGIELQVTSTGVKIGNVSTDVHPVTGSILIQGTVSASSFTGSLSGSVTTASFATTASNLLGGLANYIPLWSSTTQQTSSNIFQSSTNNIGIGTTSPASGVRLHISGSSTGIRIENSGNLNRININVAPVGTDSKTIQFSSGSTVTMTLSSGIGSNTLQYRDVETFSIQTINGNSLMTFGSSGDTIQMHTAATERVRINSSGNVGIGTINPGATLHVQGNVSASSFIGNGSLLTGVVFSSSLGWEYINKATLSNTTTVDFSLDTGSYKAFHIVITNMSASATTGQVYLEMSANNGSSFVNCTSQYFHATDTNAISAGTVVGPQQEGILNPATTGTSAPINGDILLYPQPGGMQAQSRIVYVNGSSQLVQSFGTVSTTVGGINFVRLRYVVGGSNSAVSSGSIYLLGRRT